MAQEYVSLYRQTLLERQRQHDVAIASGAFTPWLYPWDTLAAVYLFLAVAIAPRCPTKVARLVRYSAFFLILVHGSYVATHRRTLWFAGGYGIGLSTAWGMIMCGAVLVCNDVAQNFQRLEVRPVCNGDIEPLQNGSTAKSTSHSQRREVDLTKRKVGSVYTATDTKQPSFPGSERAATRPYALVWQGYPFESSWYHLMDWTVDLMTSFRGVGWKHRIATLAPIEVSVPPTDSKTVAAQSKATAIPKGNVQSLRSRAIKDLVLAYLAIDFLKTIMITDPYLMGLAPLESATPWRWLAALNETVPMATRVVRLSISMAGVVSGLTFIFSFSPLFFATILPAVIEVSRVTRVPLLEPWLYPPYWYPLSTSVARTGLAGLWGKFWHQMFRFGISEPSRVLIEGLKLDPRGNAARIVQLLIAFGLSGSIHALGSYTSFSINTTHPISGPLLFFLTQGLGSFVHTTVVNLLHQTLPWTNSLGSFIGQTVNVAVVVVYLYFTGPLLADDFARCGIWLMEPVPISPLRGLGFGPGGRDEGWWTWYQEGNKWVGWRQGEHWWTSSIAVY